MTAPQEMIPPYFIRDLYAILKVMRDATPENGDPIASAQLKETIKTALEAKQKIFELPTKEQWDVRNNNIGAYALLQEVSIREDEGKGIDVEVLNQYIDTALNVLGVKNDNLTLQTINDACAKVEVLRELPYAFTG